MPSQVLINIFIAVLWMFFQDDWSVLTFFGGYLAGLFVLFILRRYFKHKFYIFSLINVLRLLLLFLVELFSSSIFVMKEVIRPKITITPGIFKMETELESDVEITLLSLLLTLTPGSVVMEVLPKQRMLYIHGMNNPESKAAVIKSAERFEKAIKRVTRP